MLKITVSGPGGSFGLEMRYIQQVLEELGWKVDVIDPHPIDESLVDASTEYRSHTPPAFGNSCRLIADHQPWGG